MSFKSASLRLSLQPPKKYIFFSTAQALRMLPWLPIGVYLCHPREGGLGPSVLGDEKVKVSKEDKSTVNCHGNQCLIQKYRLNIVPSRGLQHVCKYIYY